MVWGIAAALAAGVLRDYRLFILALALAAGIDARGVRGVVWAGLTACAFFAYGAWTSTRSAQAREAFASVAAGGQVALRGRVSDYPSGGPGGTRFELVTVVGGCRVHILVRAPVFGLGYGDSVRVRGAVEPPDGWRAAYLRGRGVAGSIRVGPGDIERLGAVGGSAIRRRLWRIHERVRRRIWQGVGTRAGVPLALVLGERGFVDRRLRRALSRLGVSHLFALSGMHLALVAAGLYWALRRFRRGRRIGLVAGLALYAGVVGAIPSLDRALVMVGLLTLAAALHRPVRPLTALGDAFLLLLLVSPHVLFATGFQLSFLATLAVLLCVERIHAPRNRRPAARVAFWIRSTVAVSAGVQVLLAPVVLRYFGQLSLVAPLATLLLAPPVMALLAGSALAAAGAAVAPAVGPWLFWPIERATALFETLILSLAYATRLTAALPVPHFGLYYAGAALLWWAGHSRCRRAMGLAALAGSFIAGGRGA